MEVKQEIAVDRIKEIVKEISIPARPDLLVKFMQEKQKPNVDVKKISEICNSDAAVSLSLLKAVNSPFFGVAKKIASIPHAVMMLGLSNVTNIVSGICLRQAFEHLSNPFVENIWNRAMIIALISAKVAKDHSNVPSDEAYVIGLLRDCGIPLMVETFSNYESVYTSAIEDSNVSLSESEESEFGMGHPELGFVVAEDWHFPEFICQSVLNHHRLPDILTDEHDPKVGDIIAIISLAEHVTDMYREAEQSPEWIDHGASCLERLNIEAEQLTAIEEEILTLLEDSPPQ